MKEEFARTAMLIGEDGVQTLAQKRVAVFGVGGVGGFVCEALARAGIGALDLFDDDEVAQSNLNRQIVALNSTVGQKKVAVMAARIADINPQCIVRQNAVFYTPENADEYPMDAYDCVVDAVDTVSAKLSIITKARQANVPVISSMGAGNKVHPEFFEIADIEKTSMCPLARVIRKELKQRRIHKVKVVYSKEKPLEAEQPENNGQAVGTSTRPGKPKTVVPGSISFVPATAGLILAGAVVRDLLEIP